MKKEINVNTRGSSTVEAALLVPLILSIIAAVIMLLITSYVFSAKVLDGLESTFYEPQAILVEEDLRLLNFSVRKTVAYNPKRLEAMVIQNTVEYLIYLSQEYQDVLKQ